MMSNLIPEYQPLPQLQKVAQHLAAHAFWPGTASCRNHTQQVQTFLCFMIITTSTSSIPMSPPCGKLCLFITYLIHSFPFARSIHNYVSRVRTLHKELGLTPTALKSFQVSCMLRAANISM